MIESDGTTLFSASELRDPDSREVHLAPGFAEHLADLRIRYGAPMILTSACRSKKYNAEIGGHSRSLHVYDEPAHPTQGCAAVDVAMHDSEKRARLVQLALAAGWSVGCARTFVHLDRRIDFIAGNSPRVFFYGAK